MKLDLLFIAAHPDDVELGAAGVILKYKKLGKKIGIIDLTRGELGTRGSALIRTKEAAEAAKILDLDVRENLDFKDAFFINDEAHQKIVIAAIRKYQPEIVITNAYHDRHPDHGRACELVNDACFFSGLVKIETENNGEKQTPWRPNLLLHFIQDNYIQPDIIIDITEFMDKKIESIKAYKTQFFVEGVNLNEPQTYISNPEFLEVIVGRAREFGKAIKVPFAEGFLSKKILGVDDLFNLR